MRSRPSPTRSSPSWRRRRTRSTPCSRLWSTRARWSLGRTTSSRFKLKMMILYTFECMKVSHVKTSPWPCTATRPTRPGTTRWNISSSGFWTEPTVHVVKVSPDFLLCFGFVFFI